MSGAGPPGPTASPIGVGRGPVELSIVTVTWNSAPVLPDLIRSLRMHPPSRTWELIVIDNGSSDGTAAAVTGLAPWASLIENATNRGLPAANNQGLAVAAGQRILICNPDVRFEAGAIDALVAVLEQHPRAGFAIPRLQHQDGTLQTSAGDLPTLGEALLGRQWHRRTSADSGFWWDGWAHDERRRIGRGHEAAYLVRGDLVADIGGQDERFPLDWEGIDWTATARAAGWEVWFTPDAHVVHLGGASIRQVPVRWVIRSHRGMYRYFAKRRPRWLHPLLAIAFALRAGAKLVGMALGQATYARGHGQAESDQARRDRAADGT